jgi:hypothetical protein
MSPDIHWHVGEGTQQETIAMTMPASAKMGGGCRLCRRV